MRSSTILPILLLLAGAGAVGAPAPGEPPPLNAFQDGDVLFGAGPPLKIRVEAAWDNIVRDRELRESAPGRLVLTDETGQEFGLDARITPRGKSRMTTCSSPLLSIDLEPDQVAPAGQRTIHIVTQCKPGERYEQFTVKEFLSYQIYRQLTPYALGARLAIIEYVDTEGKRKPASGYGFLLEDYYLAAARLGGKLLDTPSIDPGGLEPQLMTLLGLFQYMIGNTDWSAVQAPPDEPHCCHNAVLLQLSGAGGSIPLPFDFDSSGLVDATYATPSASLRSNSVTQRLYRGFCLSDPYLDATMTALREKREVIESLFDTDMLTPKTRKKALKYLDGFYDTIENPRRVTARIRRQCRD